jgi:hypothetical protein
MEILLAALAGALATALIGPLAFAPAEVRRHDQQVANCDADLEEWLVIRHREYEQRLHALRQQMAASGNTGVRPYRADERPAPSRSTTTGNNAGRQSVSGSGSARRNTGRITL